MRPRFAAAWLLLSIRGVDASTGRRVLTVFANDRAVELERAGSLASSGTHEAGGTNNRPETRRNALARALAGGLVGAAPDADLGAARLVHTDGFVRYLETAHERWTTELRRDPSYLLPGCDAAEPALVPFHCVKESVPRAAGLAAEFACYSADFETPITAHTARELRGDLGVVRAAAAHVAGASDRGRLAYALTVHPGHHAGPVSASGFCYLNTACVACAHLRAAGLTPALLDLDFHGGNGSLDCAAALRLWFRSVHCARAYPWVEMGECGCELEPATGWADGYAAALDAALDALPAGTSVLVVSLGYDTLATDPEAGKRGGGLALRAEDFRAMGARLAAACPRVLVVQEGGYDLDGIPAAAEAFAAGLTAA